MEEKWMAGTTKKNPPISFHTEIHANSLLKNLSITARGLGTAPPTTTCTSTKVAYCNKCIVCTHNTAQTSLKLQWLCARPILTQLQLRGHSWRGGGTGQQKTWWMSGNMSFVWPVPISVAGHVHEDSQSDAHHAKAMSQNNPVCQSILNQTCLWSTEKFV